MPAKKQLTTEEKHELIGVIIQSMQWMSDAAVESDDETVNSTFDDIEDWLTELAFGRELN
jgi:hypothetical protein